MWIFNPLNCMEQIITGLSITSKRLWWILWGIKEPWKHGSWCQIIQHLCLGKKRSPVSPLTIINICEVSIAFIRQKIKKKKKKLGGAQWENTLFPKIRNWLSFFRLFLSKTSFLGLFSCAHGPSVPNW